MSLFSLFYRVAVVTGGNRGIGLEICRQLASNGVTVVLTAREEKRGAEAVSILGSLGLPNVAFHQLDISDPSSALRLADFVKEKFGKLDILVWAYGFAFLYCNCNLCLVVVLYFLHDFSLHYWCLSASCFTGQQCSN